MSYTLSYTPSGNKVSFATIKGGLENSDVESLIKIGEMDRIQANFMPRKEDLSMLNEYYYKQYSRTGFRLYSLNADHDDMTNLSALKNIQKLNIETMYTSNNIELLSQLVHLKKLFLELYLQRDFNFLKVLPIGLEMFSLETKSTVLDLAELLRFNSLKVLRLCRYKKNISRLSEFPLLEGLTLRGITPDNFSFVNQMKSLRRLRIQLGAASDFSGMYKNTSIIAMQMFRISNLDNVDIISKLPNLEAVELSELPHITCLPDLSANHRLKHILLDNMKTLTDLSSLEYAPALESVSFAQCPRAFEPSDILPVLRNPSVQSCSFYTSGDKRNQAIQRLITEHGKRNENNFITTRKVLFDYFTEF